MRAGFLVAAISSSGLMACTLPAPDPSPEATSAATNSTATAIVAIERSSGPGDAVHGDSITARFVRVRQGNVDDPALRIAGVAEDLPALGSCADPGSNAPSVQGRTVELLDVGTISIAPELAAHPMMLTPRVMPDPAGVVSGVFYSSRSVDLGGSHVTLRAAGGGDLLEGFSANVTVPRDLGEVRVTTTGATNNATWDVAWDATEADAHDLVYVDVLSPAPHAVVRCAGADNGHLLLTHGALAGLEEGQVAVHRLHKESFKAKGIEPGEVRFDLAKIVAFHR